MRCDGDVTAIRIPRQLVDACIRDNVAMAHEFAHLHDLRNAALQRARDRSDDTGYQDVLVLPVNMRRPQADPNEDEGNGDA